VKEQALVQQSFALGWHMAELYHFDLVTQISATPAIAAAAAGGPPPLQGIGDLPGDDRRKLLIRQVKHDLHDLWLRADAPSLWQLAQKIDALVNAPGNFAQQVDEIHCDILQGLTVGDFRLGKSYGLGRALAEATIIPLSVPRHGFHAAMKARFTDDEIFGMQASLLDLRDWFAQHAADTVSTTLGGWGLWAVRPTIGAKQSVDWADSDDCDAVEHALRRQGDMWRGLLTGEKDPKNIAGADSYFKAMAAVVRRVSGLALHFLGTTIGLILFLLVVIAGLALYFASTTKNTTGVLAAVVALLSSLGITAGSAGASVKQAWSKAETPLWDAEVSEAIAQAAWKNPAPLGSVQAIQLLMAIGDTPDRETETEARHPNLVAIREIPVGRLGIVLIVLSTVIALFAADAGHLNRDASFFLPALCLVGFLVLIDGWDVLIGLATRQAAPYLALPERIELPLWVTPIAQWLAPLFLITGLLAGHFFWH